MLSFCHVRVESSAARLRYTVNNIWTRSRINIMSWFDLHAFKFKFKLSTERYCTSLSRTVIPVCYQPNQLTSDSLALTLPRVLVVAGIFGTQQSLSISSAVVNSRVVIIPTWRASHLLPSLDASFDLFSAVGDVPPFYLVYISSFDMFAILNRSTSTSLPNQAFWSKFKPKGKEPEPPMAVARQRLMTLAYGEFETLLKVCPSSHFCLVNSQMTFSQLPSSFNVRYLLN